MNPTLARYAWIGFGSALGGVLRYWLSGLVAGSAGETFPWGTILVNVTGSFAIGAIAGFSSPDSRFLVSPDVRQFLMAGVCGGYTTFSSFSLQTLALARGGEPARALSNVLLSVALCLAAVYAGSALATSMAGGLSTRAR
jgi:CrcB protein